MKLYTHCPHCNCSIQINAQANSRSQFAAKYGPHFSLPCHACHRTSNFHANNVIAKPVVNPTMGGVAVGGIIGLLGGPLGLLIGGGIGGAIGNAQARKKARTFNDTYF